MSEKVYREGRNSWLVRLGFGDGSAAPRQHVCQAFFGWRFEVQNPGIDSVENLPREPQKIAGGGCVLDISHLMFLCLSDPTHLPPRSARGGRKWVSLPDGRDKPVTHRYLGKEFATAALQVRSPCATKCAVGAVFCAEY
jgi:hypothetical protein